MSNQRATLLLDLDGTLVDTAADMMAALNAVLQQHGRRAITLAAVKSMIGDGITRLLEKGFAATGGLPSDRVLDEARAQFLHLYHRQPAALSVLYPDVKETLLYLKASDYTLAVCTNKLEHLARKILAELGIESLFDDIVGGDTLSVCKPAPGHLLETLERLEKSTAAAVMVGDSQNDVVAARDAGIPAIFVSYGYNNLLLETLAPDHVIDTFAELPRVLASLWSGVAKKSDR